MDQLASKHTNKTRTLNLPGGRNCDIDPGATADHMSTAVGEEIRDLRHAHGIKLSELGEARGLSVGHLSQIERGISSPSVKALHSISRALGVNISWFFRETDAEHSAERRYIVRADKRRSLNFETGVVDELLSPNLGRQLELIRVTFAPGASTGEGYFSHRGEEAGFIVSGTLELWLDDEHFILNEGDSFAFSSETPHRCLNSGSEETVIIWTVTPPTY